MASELIVNLGSGPSYEDFLKVYDAHLKGSKIVIREGSEIFQYAVLGECLKRGASLDLYKWICSTFRHLMCSGLFPPLYALCLVDHIKYTEASVAGYSARGNAEIPLRILKQMGCENPVADEASIGNIVRYVEWLFSIGRLCDVNDAVWLSLVKRLLATHPLHQDTLKRVLYMPLVMKNGEELINELFRIPRLDILAPLMGETGLLSTPAAKRCLLTPSPIPKTEMWKWAYGSAEDPVRQALDLISQQHIGFSHAAELLKHLVSLDRSSRGAISQFGALILRRILTTDFWPSCMVMEFARNMVLNSYLLPTVFTEGCPPGLVAEVTAMILQSGESELISMYHERMMRASTHPDCRKVYVRTVNVSLSDIIIDSPERVPSLVELLGRDAEIEFLPERFPSMSPFLATTFLEEIQIRWPVCLCSDDLAKLQDLGDFCLSRLQQIGRKSGKNTQSALRTHWHFAGPLTFKSLIRVFEQLHVICTPHTGVPDIKQDTHTYVLRNLDKYIDFIIESFLERDSLTDGMIRIRTPLQGAIFHVKDRLILGSHVYSTGGDCLIDEKEPRTIITTGKCSVCAEPLVAEVYRDSRDKHGIYQCGKCCKKEEASVALASCIICLDSDSELDMKIIACGHSFCSECVMKLLRDDDSCAVQCPLCRRDIKIEQKRGEVTEAEVARRFWEEYEASPAATKNAAKAREVSFSSDESDSDEEDE